MERCAGTCSLSLSLSLSAHVPQLCFGYFQSQNRNSQLGELLIAGADALEMNFQLNGICPTKVETRTTHSSESGGKKNPRMWLRKAPRSVPGATTGRLVASGCRLNRNGWSTLRGFRRGMCKASRKFALRFRLTRLATKIVFYAQKYGTREGRDVV